MSNNIIYVAIDTETTGLDVENHSVCQIALIAFDRSGFIESYGTDVYSQDQFDPKAFEVNEFTLERLQRGVSVDHVCCQINNFYDNLKQDGRTIISVMHNAPFDVKFIEALFRRSKIEMDSQMFRRTLDTVSLAFAAGIGDFQKTLSLSTVFKAVTGHDMFGQHDAYNDAEAVAIITRDLLHNHFDKNE